MGVYPNRGLQYRVFYKNSFITVLETNDTDKRLIMTPYYKERQESWFDDAYRGEWARKIVGEDLEKVTVLLNESEQNLIKSVLDSHPDHYEHGWYDVNTMSTTH